MTIYQQKIIKKQGCLKIKANEIMLKKFSTLSSLNIEVPQIKNLEIKEKFDEKKVRINSHFGGIIVSKLFFLK